MVVTSGNEEQIPQMRELAEDIGVDVFSLKTLGSHDNDELWERSLPRDHAYRRFTYDADGHAIRKKNRCKRMWNHPVVYHDGTATVCCYHLLEEMPLGNVFEAEAGGFSRLWFGPEYRGVRTSFLGMLKGRDPSPLRCATCNVNYTTSSDYVSHAYRLRGNQT
jgi:MoaA/NifB/PqqE/SkfB family radical SAM enzyme